MMTVGMLKNLCALVFLALAASSFTAPFRTCDPAGYDAAKTTLVGLTTDEDPGSLVAPLVTKGGRLTIAPPAGLVMSYFVPVPILTTPFIPPTRHARHDLSRSTVLRL
jgi:hypothetical protein